MHRPYFFYSVFFFIFPITLYGALITHYDFDFFAPGALWKAYNDYAIGLLNGNLEIPLESIGAEGWFKNGAVYMYYGIMPAIGRWPALLITDISSLPLSRLSIWLWSISALGVAQFVLLKHYLNHPKKTKNKFTILLITSFVLWFGSAHLIIIQNNSIFHEPYAVSLFSVTVFIALIFNDIVLKDNPKYRLKTYALLAAICVHARPHVAFFLYLLTLYLIYFSVFIDFKKTNDQKKTLIVNFLKKSFAPLFIMALSGFLYIGINLEKFDSISPMNSATWGLHYIHGNSASICGFQNSGFFNLLRVIPNSYYYLTSDETGFSDLLNFFSLDHVRTEYPITYVRLPLLWALPFVCLLLMLKFSFKRKLASHTEKSILLKVMLIISLASTIPTLSYTTITYRYLADLWLPFMLSIMWFFMFALKPESRLFNQVASLKLTTLILLGLFSFFYSLFYYEAGYYDIFIRDVGFSPPQAHLEILNNPPDVKKFESCDVHKL